MIAYSVCYDQAGKPVQIRKEEDNIVSFVALDESNSDFLIFRKWNAEQETPLDYISQSTPPARETTLSPSQQIILADGIDKAVVTITGEPGATVAYTINGEAQSLSLDGSGTDYLELTCDTPNTTLLVQAGTARAVIYAVEVPA